MITALLIGRKGSRGFPGKNTAPVLGKPMAWYPMKTAEAVTEIDKTAWPSGTGIIKAGLHPDKIEEYKNKYGNNWNHTL